MTSPLLFDSAFLAKLEQLHLLARKLFRGQHRAERRSRLAGSSLEFADYRNYTLGDDLRTIDWNIYGRLDRLFVKLFEQEQDLPIDLLVDASASMRWLPDAAPADRRSKFDQARRIAASLAYIALANLDHINLHWIGPRLAGDLGGARGKNQFHTVLDFLRNPPDFSNEHTPTRLRACCEDFARTRRRRGLVILLTDAFCEETDPADSLALLRYQQFEVHLVHLLDPAELDPTLLGDFRLSDSETGAQLDLTADDELRTRYTTELRNFIETLDAHCHRHGIAAVRALADAPFEDFVLGILRDGMILK